MALLMLRASPPFDCPRLLAPRSSANPNQHRHRLFFSISLCSHNPINCNGSSWRSNFWEQPSKIILQAVAGALSLALLVSSSPSVAVEVGSLALQLSSSPAELCQEGEEEDREAESVSVTNEGIVEEAWEVVNESFLDAGNRGWSPEKWLQMKNDFTHRAIQTKSKAHGVIKKMLASLRDPYTRFLSPSEMARYDVTGIGINLREIPDDSGATRLMVLGIILDGPAYSAGVRQGDEVLYVNGVDVKGKSAFEVSSLLQGPRETFVTLKVKHGKCGLVQSFTVQRQLVARTPVFYRLEKMDNGNAMIGYIHLKEFNALARKDFVIAMKLLQDSGVSCFVLDLRDNLGGLVQAGIEVAKLFLNEGETVIYTVGRDPQVQKNIVAETAPLFTAPVIVLVNNHTASASEIVAAALHDHCRAVLVGERTFGKGLIQSVFELHDGSGVVVTIGKYVTPKHMDINGNGIEPDFPHIPALKEVAQHLSQCQMQKTGFISCGGSYGGIWEQRRHSGTAELLSSNRIFYNNSCCNVYPLSFYPGLNLGLFRAD